MTRAELVDVVERWRALLLPEWRVVLIDSPPPWGGDDCFATCQAAEDYHELIVYFTDESLDRPDAEVHVTVAHELMHALLRPMRQVVDRVIPFVPSSAYAVVAGEQSHHEEQLVERLARVLVGQAFGLRDVGPTTVLDGAPGQKSNAIVS